MWSSGSADVRDEFVIGSGPSRDHVSLASSLQQTAALIEGDLSMSHKCVNAWVAGGVLLASQLPLSAHANDEVVGALYTMSNPNGENSVVMFDRNLNGKLRPPGKFATAGLGTGSGLGNQGAVILDPADRWLFVANPGSNDISVFAVGDDGLSLIDLGPHPTGNSRSA